MADNREIAYCSARANPIAHVQVADFSHVQYLRVPHSEPEIDDRAGKGEPGEERVGREHHPDPLALQNPPSPKSAQVNSPKLNIQTPQSPQPDETKLEKETAPLASGKKRKNQKKTEKARQKEKEKKADKAKNAAESMASNAESSQTPPSPTANTDPEGPLPSSEATKAESSSPPDQSPDEPEKKEQDIDSKPVAESQPPVEDAKHEETEDGEIKAADVTDVVPAHAPTNESSNTPGPEQPDDPVASEPTPEPVKQPESTHSSVDLPADGPAGKAGEEIALEAAQKPAKADETPVSQPSANSAGDERSATSDSTAADQSPPTEKESRPRDRHANDQGVAGPTPGSDPVVDNSGTGKPGVDSDPLSDNPSAEASADALPSNDQTTIIHEEAEGHAHVEENITAMPESDGATHSEDNGKAEDETEATGAPGPTETEPQAENTPEASVESSAQGKLEQAPQKEDVDTTADGAPAPKDTELEETRLDETNKPKMEENESQNVSAIETIAATLPQTGETEDEPAGRSVEPVVHPEGVVDEAPQPTKEQVTTESEEPHDSLAVDMSSNGNEDANNPAAEPPIPTPGDTHPVEFLNTQDTTESESTTQEGKSSDEPKASSDVESKGNIDESDTNAEDAKQIGEVEGAAGTQEVKPLTLEQACTVAVPLTEDATEVPADEMPANNATENLENIESAPDSEVKPADDGTEVEDAIPLAVQGTKNDASGVSHEITSPSIDSPASEAQGGNSGTQDLSDENTGDSLKPSDSNPENMEGASMGASGDENTQIAIEPLDPPISTNNAEGGPTAGEVSSIPETDDAAKTTVTALDVSPEGETHDTIAAIVAESTEPAASGAQDEPSEEPQKCVDGQATIESSADDPDEGGAAETIEDKYESPPEMSPPEPARPAESTEATEKVASSEAAPELISPEDASTIQDKRESNDDTNTGPPKETPADPMSVKEPATSDEAPEPISPKDASAGQDRPESSDDTKTEPLEETSADAVSVKEPETSEEQPVEEILAPIETTESSGEPVTQEGASPTDENIELESTLPEDQAKNPATPDTTDPPIIQPAEAGNSVEITNAEPLERGETPGENMDVIPTKEHGDIDVPDSEPEAVVASQETPLQETSVVEKHDGVPEDQSDHEPPETTLPTKDVASTPETPELQTSTQVAENTDSKESTDEQVITAAVPENPPLEIKEASLPADKVAVDSLAGETAPTPERDRLPPKTLLRRRPSMKTPLSRMPPRARLLSKNQLLSNKPLP
ncbi:hypothetical protein GGS23DRAFT_249027 [Durotheca rogersii]|uniref:uncharacterized protein n=1 Tax=Durotheca rogersii TaxID=419775 RepID=UPI00221F9A9E|nr:uncharacterized protein GGS23DRAFT_249027 [Durotheca rogersii]KAI5860099.1 hypothetical protein GGS23DRAFT_249027 [Durotheca rogersii]